MKAIIEWMKMDKLPTAQISGPESRFYLVTCNHSNVDFCQFDYEKQEFGMYHYENHELKWQSAMDEVTAWASLPEPCTE